MKLTESILKAFYPAKLFKDNKNSINSIDYSDSGELLITSAEDDTIDLYDCVTAKHLKKINSHKYGCDNIRFTHISSCVLHTSTKKNDSIKYLSLHDTSYLRYFSGHKSKVLDLVVSPENDTFVSVSTDKTARLWDLRSPDCQGLTQPNNPPLNVKMDPKGLIFAVSTLQRSILLFDLRSFDKGHFCEFSVPISSTFGPPEPHRVETSSFPDFEFSADGKKISTLALNDTEAVISIMDSFEGRIYSCLTVPSPWGYLDSVKDPNISSEQLKLKISGTPNSQFFLSFMPKRCLDLQMHAWKYENGRPVSLFDPCVNTHSVSLASSLNNAYHTCLTKFNHKYMMITSTCDNNLLFWQPDTDKTF